MQWVLVSFGCWPLIDSLIPNKTSLEELILLHRDISIIYILPNSSNHLSSYIQGFLPPTSSTHHPPFYLPINDPSRQPLRFTLHSYYPPINNPPPFSDSQPSRDELLLLSGGRPPPLRTRGFSPCRAYITHLLDTHQQIPISSIYPLTTLGQRFSTIKGCVLLITIQHLERMILIHRGIPFTQSETGLFNCPSPLSIDSLNRP